jgi:hypothetical protein
VIASIALSHLPQMPNFGPAADAPGDHEDIERVAQMRPPTGLAGEVEGATAHAEGQHIG